MKLTVEGLVRQWPGATAPVLRGLSFEVDGGALVSLLGQSGAGKSTLLRCLMGLEPFDSGEIHFDGIRLRGTTQQGTAERAAAVRALRSRVGLVFQGFELFSHLTALENCTLAPVRVKGEPRAVAEARARALLEQLGLADRADAAPDSLSGGQKQRVAIARALCMAPKLLLYDEPTSALDPSLKQEVLKTLQRLDGQGVTQLVVTHDLQLARGSRQVFVLAQGQVVEGGAPQKVLVTPEHASTRALLGLPGDSG